MAQLRRPSVSAIAARLELEDQHFTYPEVAATANLGSQFSDTLRATYDVDRRSFPLGVGKSLFGRARSALADWDHLNIPWLEIHGASSRVHSGQTVGTLISVGGLWFWNPCRVVYAELSVDSNVAAFAYGTLRGHPECGEERFAVSFDPITEEVVYEISAFSRPATLLAKLGYPFVRKLQRRFAESSAEALRASGRLMVRCNAGAPCWYVGKELL